MLEVRSFALYSVTHGLLRLQTEQGMTTIIILILYYNNTILEITYMKIINALGRLFYEFVNFLVQIT